MKFVENDQSFAASVRLELLCLLTVGFLVQHYIMNS